MAFRHPSRKALREWIDKAGKPSVDAHLQSCTRCAAILEELEAGSDVAIGDALAAVFTPPANLADRLERGVAARLDSRVILEVVSDLFGAGIETSKLLLTEESTDE